MRATPERSTHPSAKTGRHKSDDNLSEFQNPPSFLIELPCPIEREWHDTWGPLLAGFPVELVYVGVRPRNDVSRRPIVVKARDLGSFSEDDSRKQIRYLPRLPGDYYVEVAWKKETGCWETSKFKADQLIAPRKQVDATEAISLRGQGASWAAIGEALGVGEGTVRRVALGSAKIASTDLPETAPVN